MRPVVVDDGRPPAKERSPQLKELDFMVGTWDTEAIAHYTPDAKEFKAKMVTIVQWSPNGQFLISDEWALMPASNGPKGPVLQGWLNEVIVTTWNLVKKEYTMIHIFSTATYTLTQDSLYDGGIAHGETNEGGHITETWASFKRVSDAEMGFRVESSVDHGPRWVSSEGVSKKRHQ